MLPHRRDGRGVSGTRNESRTTRSTVNSQGQTVAVRDADQQTTAYTHDPLGRLIERREYAGAEGSGIPIVTVWSHDTYADGNPCPMGARRLKPGSAG